ncbi:hypothetical protein AGMMS4957_00060 [Bacteroidia bacterium]|nr:hypothetical protein AGMMS4957_00060 [Bacteroidia bacterium]
MKTSVTFAMLFLALTVCGQQKHPQGIEHVVIIGIDGLSTPGLLEASTPCMDNLMREGAYSYDVRCVLPSVSAPNWAAMLNGAGPEATGVLGNEWRRDQWDLPAVAKTRNRMFPNIFTVLHEQKPDFEIGSIYQWGGIALLLETEILNRYERHSPQLATAQKTAEYIVEKKPNFLFIQLDDVDGVGHSQGHMSAPYLKKIEETDGHIQLIVDAIKTAGIADKTLIMIVSDHGGIYYAHGGNAYEELATPIIFSGKGSKKNYHIRQQIYKYDVAACAAFAFGLKQPQVWTGRPVIAAFEGFDEPDNLWEGGIEMLPPPVFLTQNGLTPNGGYGGMVVDEPAKINFKKPRGVEGEIYYTTDGSTPTKESTLYSKPFDLAQPGIVTAKLFGATGESPKVQAVYRISDTKAGNGLNYAVYHLPNAEKMPSFAGLKPASTGTYYEFGFHLPENAKGTPKLIEDISRYKDHLGAVFSGWLQIDTAGDYNFDIWSTGGSRLYIDNERIADNSSNGHTGSPGMATLSKGFHSIKIEFFHDNEALGSVLIARYEGPGIPKQFIPAEKLFLRKKEGKK